MQRNWPKKIYAEITTYCNLRCPMCVKWTSGSGIREDSMTFATFKGLAEALRHAEALVLNGIGEPLLNADLPAMIALARSLMPQGSWIGLQTNGLLLDENMARQLLKAGLNRLCLSLDGPTGESAGRNGHGAYQPSAVFQALAVLGRVRQAIRPTDFQLGIETVLMKDNIALLPDLVVQAADHGADFILASHLLAYQADMEDQCLFNPNTDSATQLFARYQKLAARHDVSLVNGIQPIWSNPKDESARRVCTILRQLTGEARAKNIPLHLKSLAAWHSRDLSQLASSTEKARTIAATRNIRLELPASQALAARSCRFIDDGAIFITPAGEVAPCHALWHSYSCYMDGEEKRVTAKHLGNINTRTLAEIWSAEASRTFRREAGSYDFPFCRSCALGPCPDITNESYPFANDCYGIAVPCGHCMWCLGGVRCL